MAIWLTAGFLVVVLVVGFANIECLLGQKYCTFRAKITNISGLRKKRYNIMFLFKKIICSCDFS